MIATLVQLMGEDKAFEYLKALHKNINAVHRARAPAPIKAVARGETTVVISFVHDGVDRGAGRLPGRDGRRRAKAPATRSAR